MHDVGMLQDARRLGDRAPGNAAAVDAWAKDHAAAVAEWVKANPATPEPAATDLAVVFFEDWSATKLHAFGEASRGRKEGAAASGSAPVDVASCNARSCSSPDCVRRSVTSG